MDPSDLAYHVWFKSCASFNNKPNVSKYAYAILEQLLTFSKKLCFGWEYSNIVFEEEYAANIRGMSYEL